jgi:hypothetical protein
LAWRSDRGLRAGQKHERVPWELEFSFREILD